MRIDEGVIYLAEPVFGRKILTGKLEIMTTLVDYTFSDELNATDIGLEELYPASSFSQVRIFIPLNNIIAIMAEREDLSEDHGSKSGKSIKVAGG